MKKPVPFTGTGRRRALARERHDQLSADALTYLAEDPSRLQRFFDLTGLSVDTLREATASDAFVGQLIEYMTSDAGRLTGFASAKGYDAEEVEAVRLALLPPSFEP